MKKLKTSWILFAVLSLIAIVGVTVARAPVQTNKCDMNNDWELNSDDAGQYDDACDVNNPVSVALCDFDNDWAVSTMDRVQFAKECFGVEISQNEPSATSNEITATEENSYNNTASSENTTRNKCDLNNDAELNTADEIWFNAKCRISSPNNPTECDLNEDWQFGGTVDYVWFTSKCMGWEIIWKSSGTEENSYNNTASSENTTRNKCDLNNDAQINTADEVRYNANCSAWKSNKPQECDLNEDWKFNTADKVWFNSECIEWEIIWNTNSTTEENEVKNNNKETDISTWNKCDLNNDAQINTADEVRYNANCSAWKSNKPQECDLNGDWKFNTADYVWFTSKCMGEEIIGNNSGNNLSGFYFKTISIANPNNPSEWITIMDRNLWATSNDITSPDSYGYHYQWGNNYGFSHDGKINKSESPAIWKNSYNNSNYNDSTFRYWINIEDYWSEWNYDWLWWWSGDNEENYRGVNTLSISKKDRKWPCPDGYHIPSIWEWGLLIKYWAIKNGATLKWNNWLFYLRDKEIDFQQYFKLPLAGSRYDYDASFNGGGSYGFYRSSSPYGTTQPQYVRILELNSQRVSADWHASRAVGYSVRCFKNTYEPISQKPTITKIDNKVEDKLVSITQNSIEVPNQVTTNITEKQNYNNTKQNNYSSEMNEAYQFARDNWITTSKNIEKAKMNSPLTRIAMAKMLSTYAINVLWKEPDMSKWTPKFSDVSDSLNKKYDNAVSLAYQLWIMWQNVKSNNFRPYDEVTRAEFATALSRMLYWTQDGKWNIKYYEPHMSKLYNEWTITSTNPKTKEKRWYVMIMLERTAQ